MNGTSQMLSACFLMKAGVIFRFTGKTEGVRGRVYELSPTLP